MTVKWLARLVALVGVCGVGLGWVVSSASAGDNATAGSPVTLDLQFRPVVVGFVDATCNDERCRRAGTTRSLRCRASLSGARAGFC